MLAKQYRSIAKEGTLTCCCKLATHTSCHGCNCSTQGQQGQQQQHGGRGKRDRSSRPRDWDASDVSYSGSDSEVGGAQRVTLDSLRPHSCHPGCRMPPADLHAWTDGRNPPAVRRHMAVNS
jgi:hypothetical protein